jgi:hypothetical protein
LHILISRRSATRLDTSPRSSSRRSCSVPWTRRVLRHTSYCGILNVHVKSKGQTIVHVVVTLNTRRWTKFRCSIIRSVKCHRQTTRELIYEKHYFEVSISERRFWKSLLSRHGISALKARTPLWEIYHTNLSYIYNNFWFCESCRKVFVGVVISNLLMRSQRHTTHISMIFSAIE